MKKVILSVLALCVTLLISCNKANDGEPLTDPDENKQESYGPDFIVSWIVTAGTDSVDVHTGATSQHAPASVDAMTGATSTDPDTTSTGPSDEGTKLILKQMKKALNDHFNFYSDQSVLLSNYTEEQAITTFNEICSRGDSKIMHKDEITRGTAEHCTHVLTVYCKNNGIDVCTPYKGYYIFTPEEDDD